ncbi:MAG: DUF3822 family protein [Bacteroidota bacterium]|nr:DUF3822 family protein [Bacteroidota bacterium]
MSHQELVFITYNQVYPLEILAKDHEQGSGQVFDYAKNYISLGKKFYSDDNHSESLTDYYPLYPNEVTIVHQEVESNRSIRFQLNKNISAFSSEAKIKHISTYTHKLVELLQPDDVNGLVILISKNTLVCSVRLNNKPYFINIYSFETEVEILYIVRWIYNALKLNSEKDPITLMGDIQFNSRVVQVLSIYYQHVRLKSGFEILLAS